MTSGRLANLTPPPRPIPLGLWLGVYTNVLILVGALVAGFGMIPVWIFVLKGGLPDDIAISLHLRTAPGVVEAIEPTSVRVNNRPVPYYRYRFVTPDGATRDGACYATGQPFAVGDVVTVEYVDGDPTASRIAGGRCAAMGYLGLLFLMSPGAGLILIAIGWPGAAKASRLLRYGVAGKARVVGRRPTAMQVNRQTVFEFRLAFKDEMGAEHTFTARTHRTDLVGDEAEEPILYDPLYPEQAVVVDAIPAAATVDEFGQWAEPGEVGPYLKAALIALVAAAQIVVLVAVP